MAEPIQLDKAWMEHFINVDVHDFQAELKKILKDKGIFPRWAASSRRIRMTGRARTSPRGRSFPSRSAP
ncbi:hypothetical protein SAZ11_00650 [Streptomyces sp. FXJ1.4098]|nr:hypothetical protein [Streptomyces sp. FXJ1.4098]